MVRSRTSSSGGTRGMVSAGTLLPTSTSLGATFLGVTPTTAVLLQSSFPEHFEKLLLRPHIDRLRDQLPFPVVDKTLRNALDHKYFIYLPPGIEQHGKRNLMLADKRLHLRRFFIGNSKHHQPLRSEAPVKRLEIRYLLAAWRTSSRPKIHQHNFAPQFRKRPSLAGKIFQRELRMFPLAVIRLQPSHRRPKLLIVIIKRRLDMLVTHQRGKLKIWIRRLA